MTVQFHPKDDRVMAMLVARLGGASLQEIGDAFGGLTRERVRQVLAEAGWGGRAVGKELGVIAFGNQHTAPARWRRSQRASRARCAKRKAARRRHIRELQRLSAALGRPATLRDLALSEGRPRTTHAHYLYFWKGQPGNSRKALQRLFRMAGLPLPVRGRRP